MIAVSRLRSGAVKAMTTAEHKMMATVINTCEYCSEVMEELEASVTRAIDPALAAQVFFANNP